MISEKLIVSLDLPDFASAKKMVEKIGDQVVFYKIGLELMMSGDYFDLIEWLRISGKKIFADLKLYDISRTVGNAVCNLATHQVDFLTIHSTSKDIIKSANDNKGQMNIIAVTLLTNLNELDVKLMGYDPRLSIVELTTKKAALALENGCDGLVCSAFEALSLRNNFGSDFKIITPAIRLKNIQGDDQKRIASVETAIKNGSDYLVVGRPILQSEDPKSAASNFQELIAKFS